MDKRLSSDGSTVFPLMIDPIHQKSRPSSYNQGYRVIIDSEGFNVCEGFMGAENAALILAAKDLQNACIAALENGDEYEAQKIVRAALEKSRQVIL